MAGAGGLALAAPIFLPAVQVASLSIRATQRLFGPQPPRALLDLAFQQIHGLPISQNPFYQEGAAYVGFLALVLACVAVAVLWRNPVVLGLTAAAVVCIGVAFVGPLQPLLRTLPFIGVTRWARAIEPLAFCLAMLGGVGVNLLGDHKRSARVGRWSVWGFTLAALAIGVVWLCRRSIDFPAMRASNFFWPIATTAAGLGLFTAWRPIRARFVNHGTESNAQKAVLVVGVALLTVQSAFLIDVGAPVPSSTSIPFSTPPAVRLLKHAIGPSLVGVGNTIGVGFTPNTNVLFGVRQFTIYDGDIPRTYFMSWGRLAVTSPGDRAQDVFAPKVDTVSLARVFGVNYLLEPSGAAGPPGTTFVRVVGNEALWRVADSWPATLTPLTARGGWPSPFASGSPATVREPNPAEWRIVTKAKVAEALRLRLTNLPGWSATIDGKPLKLHGFTKVMLQARIPPGRHLIELRYWPQQFSIGLILALCAVVGLALALGGAALMRRLAQTSTSLSRRE